MNITPCDRCHSNNALPLEHRPGHTENLCPACTARAALEDAATLHLRALLAPAVAAWAQHWNAAGVRLDDLADTVGSVAASLGQDLSDR